MVDTLLSCYLGEEYLNMLCITNNVIYHHVVI